MTAVITNTNSTIEGTAQALVDANAGLAGAKTSCTTLLNAATTDNLIQYWTVIQTFLNNNPNMVTTSSAAYPFWTYSNLGTF